MTDSEKVIKNMSEVTEHILDKLDKEINSLSDISISRKFDKELSRRIVK